MSYINATNIISERAGPSPFTQGSGQAEKIGPCAPLIGTELQYFSQKERLMCLIQLFIYLFIYSIRLFSLFLDLS